MKTFPQHAVNFIDSDELDGLVQEELGLKGFDCIDEYSWNNGECHVASVDRPSEVEAVEAVEELENFLEGRCKMHWSQLLAILAQYGKVPFGIYCIQVSW